VCVCSSNLEVQAEVEKVRPSRNTVGVEICSPTALKHNFCEFMINPCTKFTCLAPLTIISKIQEHYCTASKLLFYIQKEITLPKFSLSFQRSINIAAPQSVAKELPVVPQIHAYALQKRNMCCAVIQPTARSY
jgi:hypothetical protein